MSWLDRFVMEGVRAVRRLIIAVVGLTVLVVGLLLIVLPGPAFVVIPVGLGILAIEFEWARRLMRRARDFYRETLSSSLPSRNGTPPPHGSGIESDEAKSDQDSG